MILYSQIDNQTTTFFKTVIHDELKAKTLSDPEVRAESAQATPN